MSHPRKHPRKPRVITDCVANRYARPDERIIEIADAHGNGALLAVSASAAGLLLEIYNAGPRVAVRMDKALRRQQAEDTPNAPKR